MRILTVPQDVQILRSISQPIQKIDQELIELLLDLGHTLKSQRDPDGIGLSAIQVGRPIRVFATLLPAESSDPSSPSLKRSDLSRKGRTFTDLQLRFYLNPEIIANSPTKTLGEELSKDGKPFLEGCLSIPRYFGPVLRWPTITARAVILTEKDLTSPDIYTTSLLDTSAIQRSDLCMMDISARVFQHEVDHLNGILFIDHTIGEGQKLYHQQNRELVALEGI